jgi:Spy/CpxP family protein refolding chaperone
MKKSFLIAICLLAVSPISSTFTVTANAAVYQSVDQIPTPPSPDKVVEMMSSKLSLTDTQKTQITPIIADRQQKMATLKADTSMRKFKKAREAKSIMGDSDQKIEAVLTPDQKKKYEEIKEQMKEQMKERMKEKQASSQ